MKNPEDYSQNRYYLNSPEMFLLLLKLVKSYPNHYCKILLAKKRKRFEKQEQLVTWIENQKTQFINIPLTYRECIYWILNDMVDYNECENLNCSKKITRFTSNGYTRFCCLKCAATTDSTKEKRMQTSLTLYGSPNVFSSEYGKAKIKESCLKNLGVPYSGMSQIKKKHTEETVLRKYGVKNVNQCSVIKQRGVETAFKRYGQLFNFPQYRYNNILFDSGWELAYFIWLTDNNIIFRYHPLDRKIQYFDKSNNIHTYYPDFEVQEQLVEIKGSQYFNNKGEPFNRMTKEYWWEKYNCLIQNNVKLITQKEINFYLEYILHKYGKKYIQSFKIDY